MNETVTLNALVADLARLRAQEAEADAEYKAALAEFEAENAAVIDRRKAAKAAADEAYQRLANTAESAFEDTGDKKPHEVVEIKIASKFIAPDDDPAREWALRNMPGLLSINWKAYEALYLARGQNKTLDGLLAAMPGQVITVAKAYIARDLSAYLAQPEPETEAVQS